MCLRPRLGGLGRPCPWRASIGSSSLRHHEEPVWAGGVRSKLVVVSIGPKIVSTPSSWVLFVPWFG
jgi:hypothetical protein